MNQTSHNKNFIDNHRFINNLQEYANEFIPFSYWLLDPDGSITGTRWIHNWNQTDPTGIRWIHNWNQIPVETSWKLIVGHLVFNWNYRFQLNSSYNHLITNWKLKKIEIGIAGSDFQLAVPVKSKWFELVPIETS